MSFMDPQFIIELVNTAGLGLAGAGLFWIYRALIRRSELLSESVEQLEKAHQAVIGTMEKRAAVIDSRFDEEKQFRDRYMGFISDGELHQDRIKKWKEDEVQILSTRLTSVVAELQDLQRVHKGLLEEHRELQETLLSNEAGTRGYELEAKQLRVELHKAVARPTPPPPAVRGLY